MDGLRRLWRHRPPDRRRSARRVRSRCSPAGCRALRRWRKAWGWDPWPLRSMTRTACGALSQMRLVVHAVGPYVETGAPIAGGVSPRKRPMSILPAGEARKPSMPRRQARAAGMPADRRRIKVTYGDCLARHVVDRLPDAALQLSIAPDNFTTSPAVRAPFWRLSPMGAWRSKAAISAPPTGASALDRDA